MTIETVPATDTRYYLINFDKQGLERREGEDGRLSDQVAQELANRPITDVFLMSHGWKGDVPAAKLQYDAWIGAMLSCHANFERRRAVRPGFLPC